MSELIITIRGDKSTIDRLSKLGSSLNDLYEPFTVAGTELTKFFSSVPFSSRGAVYGRSWPALNPQYAKRKAKKWGGGRPILVASGKLASSFVFQSTKNLLRIYNSTGDLFEWHQMGRGHNPQRVMMLLDQQRRQIIIDAVRKDVIGKLKNG